MQSGIRFAARTFLFLFSCALALCGAFAQTATSSHSNASTDYTHDVYPFLGVDWGGNTFVGAAVPFGAVKLGPDMENFDSRPSGFGYMSGGRILGFSHLHLSGASGKYGNILVAPVTGTLDIADIKSPRSVSAVNTSRAEKGSSIRMMLGCVTNARANPTRCRIPPESSRG